MCKRCLRRVLAGESGDEAATPLSFPHINQDEANQAKFNRKGPCGDGLTFPGSAQPGSRHWQQGGLSSRLQRKGPEDGPEPFTALNLSLSEVWSKAAVQKPSQGNEGFSCLRIWEQERRRDRENEENEGEERNKGKWKKSEEEWRREKVPRMLHLQLSEMGFL